MAIAGKILYIVGVSNMNVYYADLLNTVYTDNLYNFFVNNGYKVKKQYFTSYNTYFHLSNINDCVLYFCNTKFDNNSVSFSYYDYDNTIHLFVWSYTKGVHTFYNDLVFNNLDSINYDLIFDYVIKCFNLQFQPVQLSMF